MKTIISMMAAFVGLVAFATESARIRVDTRVADRDGRIAFAVERVGEADGSGSSTWNTTNRLWNQEAEYPDGLYVRNGNGVWVPKTEETANDSQDVMVLNGSDVVGGRLTGELSWGTDTVHVVRHNLVLTEEADLTIGPETEVKFTEEARIVVQPGAKLRIRGAFFSDGYDGDARDWFAGMAEGGYANLQMLDGTDPVAPMRTYTSGETYGTLPTFDRYEDGWIFRGWKTALDALESVSADDAVDTSLNALYCNWEIIYVNPETGAVEFPAFSEGVVRSVAINANDVWTWSKDADWISVTDNGTVSNGIIKITAGINRGESPRSAVIRVSRANGKLAREITVTQPAMERTATPVISTGSGDTTFADYVETVWITCESADARIYYTTDGSEPSEENGSLLATYPYDGGVAGVFNIYGTTTVKAMAVRDDLLASSVSELTVVRADTLATAMDIPEMYVTTGGDKLWEVTTEGASDGVSCVRSGAMVTEQSRRQSSRLEMVVEGSGTLTFKWKVSCERDLTGSVNWDYLAFLCDGQVQHKIDGQTDWATIKVTLTGEGYHILTWVYTKNAAKVDIEPGEDCGWIDQVAWTPTLFVGEGEEARAIVVDTQLLSGLGLVGDDSAEIRARESADDDADGFTNGEEILLGTDINDAKSKFEVKIDSLTDEEGMKVSYPVNSNRSDLEYKLMGAKALDGDFVDVSNMTDAERKEYHFFKAEVKQIVK